MRMHRKTLVWTLLALSALVLVSLVAAGAVLARPASGGAAQPAATVYHSITTGFITRVATVDPMKLPKASASRPSPQHRAKGTRPIHSASMTRGAARAGHLPSVASLGLEKPRAGKLLQNFNGVSSLDSAVTNFGAEFEPPDQGLCEGNGFVIEPVNSAYTIYRTNGSVVTGPFNVNVLFAEGLTEFTSDPRCYFDASTHTWFATILFISADNTNARTDVAVNSSGDPTKAWTVYHIDATDAGGNGCPCFGDQPLLGIDSQNVYLSTNEFSILGPQFNGAQIYALAKSELVALDSTVHVAHFGNLSIGGAIAASVQPAITVGAANAEYFLSSLDPNGTFDNRLGVWAMTDTDAVHRGGTPTLSSVVITSEVYGVPPNAVQMGASSLLTSDDDRMQQVEFIDGSLWGSLDTAITIPNDTAERAAAAWFQVHPRLHGNAIGGATMTRQGYVAVLGNYLLYPAVEVARDGSAAMVMTLSGATFFPSAAYTVLRAGHGAFGPVQIAAPGTGNYDPMATRWGDYSAAVLDPTDNSFWLATEYMPPVSSQTPDRRANWGTRVLEVSAGD